MPPKYPFCLTDAQPAIGEEFDQIGAMARKPATAIADIIHPFAKLLSGGKSSGQIFLRGFDAFDFPCRVGHAHTAIYGDFKQAF